MKRVLSIIPIAFLLLSCASQQYLNQARRSYENGDVVLAAEQSIKSLQANPKNEKSILLLEEIFYDAVDSLHELIDRGSNGTNQFRWTTVADAYERLHRMNTDVLSLPQLLLKKEEREVSFQVTYFEKEHEEAKPLAAEENYQEGRALSKVKDREVLRNAISYFEKALYYVPGYKDTESRIEETGKSATDIVVILPEDTIEQDSQEKAVGSFTDSNSASESVAGSELDSNYLLNTRNYIHHALVSALIQGSKQKSYLKVIDPNFRDEAIEGMTNVLSGVYSEANFMEIGELFDANKIVTFTLFPINWTETDLSERHETRDTELILEETDEEYDKYPDHKIEYSAEVDYYKETYSLSLSASYRLVDVETTEIIDSNTFSVTVVDEVYWIELEGDKEVLDGDEMEVYEEFRRELKTPSQLIENAQVEIVDLLSAAILAQFE